MEENKIHNLIKSILVKENIETQAKISIKNANVEIADGLMSEIIRVTITHPEKSLNLIIKIAPSDLEYRYIVKQLYTSEIHFYEVIVPLFNDLQLKYIGKPLTFVPKFFKATKEDCEETIILEDLSPKGYVMLNRKHVFSEDCMRLVLKELGKFHALSFALQTQQEELWKSLENGVTPWEIFTGEVIDWFQDSLKKAIDLFQTTNLEIATKLQYLHDNFSVVMKNLLLPSKKYPSVICHLDTWCNNFLFKLKENSNKDNANAEIEDVVLIDFQQAMKGSPVLDISCFLYVNGSADCIKNWKEMLKLYHDSLFNHAKSLNCDLSKIYSWEMFLDDFKDYATYGILKSTMGISLNTQDDEHLNMKDGKTLHEFFTPKNWNLKTVERIEGLIIHAYHEKFL